MSRFVSLICTWRRELGFIRSSTSTVRPRSRNVERLGPKLVTIVSAQINFQAAMCLSVRTRIRSGGGE